jgi:hypothetical protein
MSTNAIRWYVNRSLDAEHLNSPQPCPRGIHCDYRRFNKETGELEPACCRGVHPGEEGTGRRLFPPRQIKETGPEGGFFEQPACVRLTGAHNQFYERRRLKLSWRDWCEREGIPYTPAEPGQDFECVTIDSIVKRSPASPPPTRRGAPPLGGGGPVTVEELERFIGIMPRKLVFTSPTEFPPLPDFRGPALVVVDETHMEQTQEQEQETQELQEEQTQEQEQESQEVKERKKWKGREKKEEKARK